MSPPCGPTILRQGPLVRDASAQAKDAEKFTSFYAEDGVVMMANAPDISGKATSREAIGGMMQDPNFALSFAANKVVVARSGDLAYETGTYAMTLSDAKKQPSTEKGNEVVRGLHRRNPGAVAPPGYG
jgi:ketosteroid isomerase-like protein